MNADQGNVMTKMYLRGFNIKHLRLQLSHSDLAGTGKLGKEVVCQTSIKPALEHDLFWPLFMQLYGKKKPTKYGIILCNNLVWDLKTAFRS